MTMIFQTIAGSRLYGTHQEDSDYDYRAVHLEPLDHLFGMNGERDQTDARQNTEEDYVSYPLRQFIRLAAKNNPNILEMLFTDPRRWTYSTLFWEAVYEQRHHFLSQEVRKTYGGYIHGALARLDRPRKNPKRMALIKRYGYDTKDAAHVLRLTYNLGTILRTGGFSPVLYDAELDFVKDIQDGQFSLDDFRNTVNWHLKQIEQAPSELPLKPPITKLDKLCISVYAEYVTQKLKERD